MHNYVIELQEPAKDKDTVAMETDLNKTLPSPRHGEADNIGGHASGNLLSNNPSSPSMERDNNLASNGQSPVTLAYRTDSGSGRDAATQYPPTQMMERADDPTSPAYRFPSHVFSRTKSTTDWSAASNESLFSIQMGNMSFTREQMAWLGKSGELYRPGESALDLSQPPNLNQSDCALKGTEEDGDMTAIEARAAETMREVIREHSENQRKESSTLTESSSQSGVSHKSESSTKSFNFPILAGDGGKSISLKGGESQKAKQEMKSESPHEASDPQTPKESSSDEPPKAAANVGPKRWFSRFSCCPLRS